MVTPGSLPPSTSASVASLDAYLQSLIASDPALLDSTLFSDFLSINWSGSDIKFMSDGLEGFFDMLFFQRMPDFMPEPPVIDQEDSLTPEMPFEVYIYFQVICLLIFF